MTFPKIIAYPIVGTCLAVYYTAAGIGKAVGAVKKGVETACEYTVAGVACVVLCSFDALHSATNKNKE